MTEDLKLRLGRRVRAQRRAKKFSLRELGSVVDCSASMLSQIENGLGSPSVALLIRLAQALSTSTDRLLGLDVPDGARAVAVADALDLRSLLIEPGGSQDPVRELQREIAVEFIYVAEGDLTVLIGGDSYVLAKGSSVRVDPARPHTFVNRGELPVRAVWGQVH